MSTVRVTVGHTSDGVDDLVTDLAAETGLDWRRLPPDRESLGLAEVVLVALVTSAAQESVRLTVEKVVEKTTAVVRSWRAGYQDPPETAVEVERDDDESA